MLFSFPPGPAAWVLLISAIGTIVVLLITGVISMS
jgi:hypothetical protein